MTIPISGFLFLLKADTFSQPENSWANPLREEKRIRTEMIKLFFITVDI